MKKMTGGQAAVEAIRAEGTSHVFGLIGSATMEMFDALYDADDIKFIGVHDERTGTHMADGFARMSGQAGVILAGQNGPGVTNLVTGLAQAKAAYSPVVSIGGALASGHRYRDAFQEVDQDALFKPITKKTWTATAADRVPEMLREAYREAMAPRRGPVQLNLPRDVLAAEAEFDAFQTPGAVPALCGPRWRARGGRGGGEIAGQCQSAGHHCRGRHQEHRRCRGLPATGRGAELPGGYVPGPWRCDPLWPSAECGSDGAAWQRRCFKRLVKEADVILGLGTRIGFNSTFYSYDNINKDAKIIHVEMEPTAIGRLLSPPRSGSWATRPPWRGNCATH